ncbi:MAG: UvrB/UvrC motif-containing protein, partial [Nitrospirota bacterium]|nr:UvrB/UvrC motif-containing protein [Nitrospirota bacterium]
RAARNINGKVIFYADTVTRSMKKAMDETDRRRKIQEEYNIMHRITPASIKKEITSILGSVCEADYWTVPAVAEEKAEYLNESELLRLEMEMKKAAERLEFERAAQLRDRIKAIRAKQIALGIRE